MSDKQYQKSEKLNVGEKDGINVIADAENNQYVVEFPNSYDVYWGFAGKVNGQEFATRIDSEDQRKAVFAVPLENLVNNTQIRNFNTKVNDARRINAEIVEEQKQFTDVLAFDQAKEGKTVAFLYKNPSSGYSIGEVLKTGKYFVALSGGENESKVFVRMVHTNRLLNGKEEFSNREESIQKMFPIGADKYMTFKDGKISVKDYTPKAKTEQKPVENEVEKLAKEMTEKLAPKKEKASTKKVAAV